VLFRSILHIASFILVVLQTFAKINYNQAVDKIN